MRSSTRDESVEPEGLNFYLLSERVNNSSGRKEYASGRGAKNRLKNLPPQPPLLTLPVAQSPSLPFHTARDLAGSSVAGDSSKWNSGNEGAAGVKIKESACRAQKRKDASNSLSSNRRVRSSNSASPFQAPTTRLQFFLNRKALRRLNFGSTARSEETSEASSRPT